jgi:hypothetical protein
MPHAPRRAERCHPARFLVRSPVHSAVVYVNGQTSIRLRLIRIQQNVSSAKPAKRSASAALSPRLRTNLEVARHTRAKLPAFRR